MCALALKGTELSQCLTRPNPEGLKVDAMTATYTDETENSGSLAWHAPRTLELDHWDSEKQGPCSQSPTRNSQDDEVLSTLGAARVRGTGSGGHGSLVQLVASSDHLILDSRPGPTSMNHPGRDTHAGIFVDSSAGIRPRIRSRGLRACSLLVWAERLIPGRWQDQPTRYIMPRTCDAKVPNTL